MVVRGEILRPDASGVLRVSGPLAVPLEIAQHGAAAGIREPADRRVRVRRRVVNLGDVEHRRHAGVELAQRAEQHGDVGVLRPVDAGELAQDEIEIVHPAVRQAVVEQQAVRKEATQRGLELVVVGIDEARHDDHAVGLDHVGAAGVEVRSHRGNGSPVDQHIGDCEIANGRVHGEHRAAADDVASAGSPGVRRQGRSLRPGRPRTQERRTHGGGAGRSGGPEEVAPRPAVELRVSGIRWFAHSLLPVDEGVADGFSPVSPSLPIQTAWHGGVRQTKSLEICHNSRVEL